MGINAGADESNANGEIILLPKNPNASASRLCTKLKKHFRVKDLGIIITDTRSTPLRIGTTGRAIGYAGFDPIKSYVGKKDLYGRKSRVTESNLADALAAAAVCVMGEGNEQIPLARITDAPVSFETRSETFKRRRLWMLPHEDIFARAYAHVSQTSSMKHSSNQK